MCVISTCGRGCMLSKLSNAQIFQSYSVRFHQILFCLIFSLCPWLSHKRIPNFGKEKLRSIIAFAWTLPCEEVEKSQRKRGNYCQWLHSSTPKCQFFSFGANHNSASNDVYHRFWWHKQRQKDIGKFWETSKHHRLPTPSQTWIPFKPEQTLHGVAETSFPDTDLISRLPVSKGVRKGIAMVASSKCKQETYSEEYYCHIKIKYHIHPWCIILSFLSRFIKRKAKADVKWSWRISKSCFLSRFHHLSPSFTFWTSNLLPYGEDDTRNTHDLTIENLGGSDWEGPRVRQSTWVIYIFQIR